MLKSIPALSGLLLGSAVVLVALPALAQNQPPPPPPADAGHFHRPFFHRPTFAELDTNHDGSISEAEFDAARPPRGPDGMMAKGGWRHHSGPDMGHGPKDHGPMDMKAMDTDGDGKISFAEFSARMKAHFDRLDTNHDGVLEAGELPQPPADGPPENDAPPPQK